MKTFDINAAEYNCSLKVDIDLIGVSLSVLLSKGKIELNIDEIEERFKEAFNE